MMISVIVAAYNVERYIGRCVNSILNSTYKDLEVIVVDDGSSDETGKLLDSYKDERLKVIHKENGGVSSARNAGLEIASGAYITFVDGDDYIDDFMLEEMVNHIANEDIIETTQFFANDSKTWRKPYQTSSDINGKFLAEDKEALLYLTMAPHSRLYRSGLLKDMRFPEGLVFEDNYFITMLFPKLMYVTKLETTHGYFHYQREGSTTMSADDRIFDMLEIHKLILEEYKKLDILDEYFLLLEKNAIHDLLYSTIGRKFAHYKGERNLKEEYNKIMEFVRDNYPYWHNNGYLSSKEKKVCRMVEKSYMSSKLVGLVAKVSGH